MFYYCYLYYYLYYCFYVFHTKIFAVIIFIAKCVRIKSYTLKKFNFNNNNSNNFVQADSLMIYTNNFIVLKNEVVH